MRPRNTRRVQETWRVLQTSALERILISQAKHSKAKGWLENLPSTSWAPAGIPRLAPVNPVNPWESIPSEEEPASPGGTGHNNRSGINKSEFQTEIPPQQRLPKLCDADLFQQSVLGSLEPSQTHPLPRLPLFPHTNQSQGREGEGYGQAAPLGSAIQDTSLAPGKWEFKEVPGRMTGAIPCQGCRADHTEGTRRAGQALAMRDS